MNDEQFPTFGPQEHVGAIGTTRAGKSTLFKRKIIPEQSRVLAVDTKNEDWNHLPVVQWKTALTRIQLADKLKGNHAGKFRWRIRLGVGEAAEEEANQFAYEALKKLRNVTIYWDEIGSYCTAQRIGDGLKMLITQGGGRDLRFYWGTQRTAGVNGFIADNTAHMFLFHVKMKDRTRIKAFWPYYPELAPQVPFQSYKFIYEDPSGEARVMGPV
jgi:hypothetical protein